MKVSEFMITDVISVTKDQSIKELLELLVKHKIGGVPVVDETNTLQGMITDGDVVRYLNPRGRTVYDMFSLVFVTEKEELQHKLDYAIGQAVGDMRRKKDTYYVHPDDDLDSAISILSKHHFKKIPVIDSDHKVVGVISRGDIIRYITTKLL
ncbi:CBS domain-containing protein [Lentibacillus sp. L22]|nr:CBS domain-containing protein [Lentibacillus daqui]